MTKNNLPNNIAIFPLSNAIFFPRTILPLNIFEKRYLQLVTDCMKSGKMFGMVQPKNKTSEKSDVYQVGCLGKIINFRETSDKRFVINLSGIIRFKIKEEIKNEKLYRKFIVDYADFMDDLKKNRNEKLDFNKSNLLNKIKKFFQQLNYSVEYNELKKLNFDQLINTICMISPFSTVEKQKLIETVKLEDKFKVLDKLINFNLIDFQKNKTIQ